MSIDAGQQLIAVEEALRLLLAAAAPLAAERVAVAGLAGRVTAADAVATGPLPGWDNSALDGWALRAEDAATSPPVTGAVAAGDDPEPLPAGAAVRIATGAVVPRGADCIVPIEQGAEQAGRLRVDVAPALGAGIRRRGADVAAGAIVVPRGTRLGPLAASSVAACGISGLDCARRPRAAVLITGDELVPPGSALRRGQVHESNGVLIASVLAADCETTAPVRVPDDREATVAALAEALTADLVIVSGGVSVGPRDHVKPALAALGVRQLFWRLAVQPGKPAWGGVAADGTPVLALPGNPLSVLVGLELLARPLIDQLLGVAQRPARDTAWLTADLKRSPYRLRVLPARLSGGDVEPLGAEASHQVGRAGTATALVLVPRGEGLLAAGSRVEVVPLQGR